MRAVSRGARSQPLRATRRKVPRRCSPPARSLAAVVVVAAVAAGLVGASAPAGAQTAASSTFSDPPFYTDVAPPERDLLESEKQHGGWIEHGRVWSEGGAGYYVDRLSPYWAIQSLARAGVFAGTDCARGRFCPDSSLTHWQLAVWLMRSLGERDLAPIDESRFADVDPDDWWARYVERAAELGISTGCARGPLRYCPNATVDRGHAATVVSRALARLVPDVGIVDPAGFTDLDRNDPLTGHVDRVVTFELLEACNQDPLRFCRRDAATKAQMAVILFRSLDWLQLNTIAERSPVPGDIFLTEYNKFSWYVKTQVVDEYGDDQPWLKAAWNITNRTTSIYMLFSHHNVFSVDYTSRNSRPHGETHYRLIAQVVATNPRYLFPTYHPAIVHELAHVYTKSSDLVVEDSLPIAAAHLYFEELAGGADRCIPYELFADTAPYLIFEFKGSSNYWGACTAIPHYDATDEAIEVVRDAFSGTVPQWFYDTFQQSDGSFDYEAIWSAVIRMEDYKTMGSVVHQFEDFFGGYCADDYILSGGRRVYNTYEPGVIDHSWIDQSWVDEGCGATATDVRIVARRLADGRIKFGLQRRDSNTWGDRQLPRVRFFPTTTAANRWLASSPLDVAAGDVRIVARRLADGRIEFGLQRRGTNTWGDRQLPRVRFFPTTTGANRWLVSSPLTLQPAES